MRIYVSMQLCLDKGHQTETGWLKEDCLLLFFYSFLGTICYLFLYRQQKFLLTIVVCHIHRSDFKRLNQGTSRDYIYIYIHVTHVQETVMMWWLRHRSLWRICGTYLLVYFYIYIVGDRELVAKRQGEVCGGAVRRTTVMRQNLVCTISICWFTLLKGTVADMKRVVSYFTT